jgi:CRISPR-associated protein Csd1
MLLQRLAELSDRIDMPPERYQRLPVRYLIDLDATGKPLSRELIDLADPNDRETRNGKRMLIPNVQRASGVKPLLLADKADYTVGLAEEGADAKREKRIAQCHASYCDLVNRCARETGEPLVEAVAAFLDGNPLERLDWPADLDPSARISFRVDGIFPFELPAVQSFWASIGEVNGRVLPCLVCGEHRPAQERLEAKLKGIPGGQTSGTALISANSIAFESFGLEASQVSPICAGCAKRFTDALNHLLASESSRVRLGGSVFVFWTREQVSTDVFSGDLLTDPKPDQVRALLESVRSGLTPVQVEETAFYGLILSASGGRAVVREWIDTTVGGARVRIAEWFRRQRVVAWDGSAGDPLSLFRLAVSTVREAKDLPNTSLASLLRCALTGVPLPLDLLARGVQRARAEQRVTYPRAALIKLVLMSNAPETTKEDWMVALEPEHPSPAYHCGRLLAVLERIQHAAIPGAKSTVIDRFYGAASSTPATVFGGLLRQAQPHLAKLERDNRGAYVALSQRLEEVCERLGSFPRTLTLEEQGLFALGYYHQQANERAGARRHQDEKAAPEPEGEV